MPVSIANRQAQVRVPLSRVRRAAERALRSVGRPEAELSLTLVDDPTIRELNTRFRGVRRRTDVLAFPLDAPLIGEVILSVETAHRQANRLRVALALELELLVTHGVLHLAGYDDRDPVEARLMHERERQILEGSAGAVPARLWTGLLP